MKNLVDFLVSVLCVYRGRDEIRDLCCSLARVYETSFRSFKI